MKKVILSALAMSFVSSAAMADILSITRQYNSNTDQWRINFYTDYGTDGVRGGGDDTVQRITGTAGQSFSATLQDAINDVGGESVTLSQANPSNGVVTVSATNGQSVDVDVSHDVTIGGSTYTIAEDQSLQVTQSSGNGVTSVRLGSQTIAMVRIDADNHLVRLAGRASGVRSVLSRFNTAAGLTGDDAVTTTNELEAAIRELRQSQDFERTRTLLINAGITGISATSTPAQIASAVQSAITRAAGPNAPSYVHTNLAAAVAANTAPEVGEYMEAPSSITNAGSNYSFSAASYVAADASTGFFNIVSSLSSNPTQLQDVYDALEDVYHEGYSDGFDDGYAVGFEDGFAAGRATQ